MPERQNVSRTSLERSGDDRGRGVARVARLSSRAQSPLQPGRDSPMRTPASARSTTSRFRSRTHSWRTGSSITTPSTCPRRRRSRTSRTPTCRPGGSAIKALAIYRDGSKTAQALRTDAQQRSPTGWSARPTIQQAVHEALAEARPKRRRMPRERQSITHKFSIGGHEGYITAGMYEDGTIGEIFLTDIGKEGSTLRGMMNSFATAISIALQYGVPLETLVRKFSYMRFEPEGMTVQPGDPVREVDARLHHALARLAVPRRRPPGGARDPHAGGARPQGRPGRSRAPSVGETARAPAARRRESSPTTTARGSGRNGGASRTPPTAALTDTPPVMPAVRRRASTSGRRASSAAA